MQRIKNVFELVSTLLKDKPSDAFVEFLHSPIVDLVVSATPNPVDEKIVRILRILFPKKQEDQSK